MLGVCTPLIDENALEITQHGTVQFPIGCYHDDLSAEGFPFHWHPELEAAVVTEGNVLLRISKQEYHLKQGDAFFVNAGVLHGVEKDGEDSSCRLHSFCVHPRLIGGSRESIFWEKYLTPLIENTAFPSLILRGNVPDQERIRDEIEEVWQLAVNEPSDYEFAVREKLSRIVLEICSGTDMSLKSMSAKEVRETERMKRMLEYVHAGYAGEITVEHLAQAAGISKSEVMRCFHSIMKTTPIQYVRSYRLRMAAALLVETDWRIIEIALHCGFQEMSYFSRAFRSMYKMTPREYRKKEK